MSKEYLQIEGIPSVLWNKEAKKIILAVHGLMSNKEDTVINILMEEAIKKDYAIISFDMPLHGERKNDRNYLMTVKNCMNDIRKVYKYIKPLYPDISIFCNSMAAYYSMQVLGAQKISKAFFLSPIVDMLFLTNNMLKMDNITAAELEAKKALVLSNGTYVDFESYSYLLNHPVSFNKPTFILYGDKDIMMPLFIIEDFVKENGANLTIYKGGEHFFYKPVALEFYTNWLKKVL